MRTPKKRILQEGGFGGIMKNEMNEVNKFMPRHLADLEGVNTDEGKMRIDLERTNEMLKKIESEEGIDRELYILEGEIFPFSRKELYDRLLKNREEIERFLEDGKIITA